MKSIGLVIAQFYEDIADAIETKAYENADDRGARVAETVYVPGVYDTPLAVDRLAKRDDIDAVVVLGAVITGDTDHDHVIANAAAHKLSDVSLDRNTPVAFG
ncbi:MAG: 6,7-dimethyl-8-ribityllumazine synthase, partial [Halobacteria archaeon]|nr:6,7-dimethyl-8-ribityllumazine synthase [Halobacteria archaeon]